MVHWPRSTTLSAQRVWPKLLSFDNVDTSAFGMVLLGLTESVAMTFVHLPQFLMQALFRRFVSVLTFHYQRLTEHMAGCNMKDDEASCKLCCIEPAESLAKLFKAIENTFCNQLLIQASSMIS